MQETIVRLKVLSTDRTPDEITAVISLSCDRSWLTGDPRAHTIMREEENGWEIGSGLPNSATLAEHIEALMLKLPARSDSVRAILATCEVELSCVIYAATPPAVGFNKAMLKWLAELGASVDIDLYMM